MIISVFRLDPVNRIAKNFARKGPEMWRGCEKGQGGALTVVTATRKETGAHNSVNSSRADIGTEY